MDREDHFSRQADDYARYRPGYPLQLFQSLAGLCQHRDRAWDCGTGNGQAAAALAGLFSRVIATDISAAQISRAERKKNIDYRVAAAEDSGLAAASIDLLVVAQALHWFDLDAFYAEARRVMKKNAVLAVISYRLPRITKDVDELVDNFYSNIIGAYWPGQRKHVDNGYRDIPFPLQRLQATESSMEHDWTLEDFLGYLRSWSAVMRYEKARQQDPLELVEDQLAAVWPQHGPRCKIRWPMTVLAGKFTTPAT